MRRTLMDTGAAAIRYNAPLGRARVDRLVEFVGAQGRSVVDLGCGAGALLIELAERLPDLRGEGIDLAPAVIERAQTAVAVSTAADRVRFSVADVATAAFSSATTAPAAADVAICIGSTHAFGTPAEALEAIWNLGASAAVVADGIWTSTPDATNREMFGQLPVGEDELASLARSVGWSVAGRDRSSTEEWDEFEFGWIGGVRSVGTAEAVAFADSRLQDYDGYRGVLGFGWLLLTR